MKDRKIYDRVGDVIEGVTAIVCNKHTNRNDTRATR